jgi:hypothetical protein
MPCLLLENCLGWSWRVDGTMGSYRHRRMKNPEDGEAHSEKKEKHKSG